MGLSHSHTIPMACLAVLSTHNQRVPLLQLSHKDHGTIVFIGDFGAVNLVNPGFLVSYFSRYRSHSIYGHPLPHSKYLSQCHIGERSWILQLIFSMVND